MIQKNLHLVQNEYPAWIDDQAESIYHAFINMVPSNWAPDGYAVLRFLDGSLLQRLSEAVHALKTKDISPAEAGKCFRSPSGLRCALYFLMLEYQAWEHKDRMQFRETMEYLVAILYSVAHEDYWIKEKNIVHSISERDDILKNTQWQKGNPTIAQELGRLYASASALVYSLYGDFFPQDACDVYGPYDASSVYGEGSILLVKHFSKLYAKELWPVLCNTKYDDIKIYQVYKGVGFTCEFIGMHTLYTGDLRTGLIAWAVEADGTFVTDPEEIRALRNHFAEKATEQAKIRDAMTKEDIQNKFVEWLCYQYVSFFALAGMQWQPTEEMLAHLRGKEIPDTLAIESMPPYEEYISSPEYETYWLKDLYKA